MLRVRLPLFVAALAIAMAGPAVARKSCTFHADKHFIDTVVLPILSKEEGKELPYFRVESPGVYREGHVVSLIYDPVNTIDGKTIMSETTFVIEV
ncbi:MAG: hypothetical protein ACREDY_27540, partial [Bradyrhizobium sp.]